CTAISAVATGAVSGSPSYSGTKSRSHAGRHGWSVRVAHRRCTPSGGLTVPSGGVTVNRLISQDATFVQGAMFVRDAMLVRPTDVALMHSVQAGARPQFAELYRRFAPRAYRTAWFACPDRDCAHDVVQD